MNNKPSHTRARLRVCTLGTLVLLCLINGISAADTDTDYQKSMSDITKEIRKISQNLNANKALLKSEKDKLSSIEQDINELRKQDRKIRKEALRLEQSLSSLGSQTLSLQKQQKENARLLEALLLQRYKNGSSNSNIAKLILNQKNPYAVGRLGNYYGYFAKAQEQQLSATGKELIRIDELKKQQLIVKAQLDKERQKQRTQQEKLKALQNKRLKTVSRLDQKVQSSTTRLQTLKEDRKRLNTLISQVAIQAKRLQELDTKQKENKLEPKKTSAKSNRKLVKGGFIKQKGRLNYPSSGIQKTKFGERLVESGMKSQGVFFQTNSPSDVRSIFRGQVLFADYLKGYGLLMIVDHGDNHISLYGHNEVLYKNVGDEVETDERISTNGISGGLKSPGLYFEIRKNAVPINPANWFK